MAAFPNRLQVVFCVVYTFAALAAALAQRGATPQQGAGARGGPPRVQPLSPSPILTLPGVPVAPIQPVEAVSASSPDRLASISGVVVRGGTNEALAGARVKLAPAARAGLEVLAELDAEDGDADLERAVYADIDGRFTFSPVDPGRYTLIAQRDGFIRQSYGQRGANAFGTVLTVSAGQPLADVILPMRPAPAISGIIFNSAMEPLAAAVVQAYRLHYTPFGRELKLAQTAMANDRGEYRLFWLSPGDYYVAASYNWTSALALPAEIPANPNIAKPDDGSAGVFFPGQTNWADAQVIRVGAADTDGVNMVWTDARRVPLRGRLTGGGLDAAGARVALVLPDGNPIPGFSQPRRTDAGGAFEFLVPPGEYVLLAESADGRLFSEVTLVRVPDRGVENLLVPLKLGLLLGAVVGNPVVLDRTQLISVAPLEDLEGVQLKFCRLGPAPLSRKSCFGNYTYPLRGKPEFKPFFLPFNNFEVFLSLPSGFVLTKDPLLSRTPVPAPKEPDDRLQVSALPTPTINIALTGLERNDLTELARGDVAAEAKGSCGFPPPDNPNACLVFEIGRSGQTVTGGVRNRAADSIPGAQVVLVPQPGPTDGVRPPNRYFATGADSAGRFEIAGVPPGLYAAFAFEELEPGAYYAPDFLQRFGSRAIPAYVGTGIAGPERGGRPAEPLNLIVIPREEANR